jgi:hypothetical protein
MRKLTECTKRNAIAYSRVGLTKIQTMSKFPTTESKDTMQAPNITQGVVSLWLGSKDKKGTSEM